MTILEEILRRIQLDLKTAKVEFAVVGALGVSIHTEPRFTRDADLAIAKRNRSSTNSRIRAM